MLIKLKMLDTIAEEPLLVPPNICAKLARLLILLKFSPIFDILLSNYLTSVYIKKYFFNEFQVNVYL
jgi:hypothetical protein